jgi:type I restriction enzyme S subunit
VKILRIDGFYDGSILEDYKYKRLEASEEEIEKYVIETGDLLINRVNSIEYLGKCGLAKSFAEPTVFESNIMRIKLNQTVADSSYVSKYLSSKRGLTELRKNAKHAVNQASINQTDVANVLLPLAPLNQQQQIIKEIETRLSVADKLEETISQSLQQAEALRQSILKQAFEGKLK